MKAGFAVKVAAALGGGVISVAEFLIPPLKGYLAWEIDDLGPLVLVRSYASCYALSHDHASF